VVTREALSETLRACDVAGPANEDQIRLGEERLGVRFPRSYRWFLETHGAALCPGFRIAGLFVHEDEDEPPLWIDVVEFTESIRKFAELPPGYVAISDDGVEMTFYLDTAKGGDNADCPVIAIGPGVDDVVADDFLTFVTRALAGRLFE
jgi:antitoxin YobK